MDHCRSQHSASTPAQICHLPPLQRTRIAHRATPHIAAHLHRVQGLHMAAMAILPRLLGTTDDVQLPLEGLACETETATGLASTITASDMAQLHPAVHVLVISHHLVVVNDDKPSGHDSVGSWHLQSRSTRTTGGLSFEGQC